MFHRESSLKPGDRYFCDRRFVFGLCLAVGYYGNLSLVAHTQPTRKGLAFGIASFLFLPQFFCFIRLLST